MRLQALLTLNFRFLKKCVCVGRIFLNLVLCVEALSLLRYSGEKRGYLTLPSINVTV